MLTWAPLLIRVNPAGTATQEAGGSEGLQEAEDSQNTQNFLHGPTLGRVENDLCSVICGGEEREVVLVSG